MTLGSLLATPIGEPSEIFKQNNFNVIIKNHLSKIYKINSKWDLSAILKIVYKIKLSAFSLSVLIFKNKIDLIIANGNFAALLSLLPAIITGKKLLVIQHLIYDKDSFEAKLLKVIIKFSTNFVCVSKAVKENIISIIGDKHVNKIVIIYNGIEIPKLSANPNINSENKIRIGIVGSIIRIKGIDLVVDSLLNIIHLNSRVHFYIYGNSNNQEDSINYNMELKTKVKTYNFEKRIHFMGYESNKDKIYSALDIVINYTTIPEALPYSVLEAMGYNKIVVAPNIGGPAEIIENNVNGFLVEPNNVNSLYERLNFLTKKYDSGNLVSIQQNARKTIEEKFSLSVFIENYKTLLNTLLN